jgi:hypothetical protein
MLYKNEFDHYNTLKLEPRILDASEISGIDIGNLKNRVKKIIKNAAKKLRSVEISIAERNALIKIASAGLTALAVGSANDLASPDGTTPAQDANFLKAMVSFYTNAYQSALADGSKKDLSAVKYFDYVADPTNALAVQEQSINDQISNSPAFADDVPHREYGMGGFGSAYNTHHKISKKGMGDVIPATPSFFAANQEKILIGAGILALGLLGYHVFKVAKSSRVPVKSNPHYAKKTSGKNKVSKAQKHELKKLWAKYALEGK